MSSHPAPQAPSRKVAKDAAAVIVACGIALSGTSTAYAATETAETAPVTTEPTVAPTPVVVDPCAPVLEPAPEPVADADPAALDPEVTTPAEPVAEPVAEPTPEPEPVVSEPTTQEPGAAEPTPETTTPAEPTAPVCETVPAEPVDAPAVTEPTAPVDAPAASEPTAPVDAPAPTPAPAPEETPTAPSTHAPAPTQPAPTPSVAPAPETTSEPAAPKGTAAPQALAATVPAPTVAPAARVQTQGGVSVAGVTRSAPNARPVAREDRLQAVAGRTSTFDVLANDSDANGDRLAVAQVTRTPGNGTTEVVSGGAGVRYTPRAGFTGADRFEYEVSDGRGGTARASVVVSVTRSSTGSAPVLSSENATQHLKPGSALAPLKAVDADGDPIVFEVVSGSLPPGTDLSQNGTFVGLVSALGTYQAVVSACDDSSPALCAERTVRFVVTADGVAPAPAAPVGETVAVTPARPVTASAPGPMPRTGADVEDLAPAGGILAALGALLLLLTRRRKDA